VSKILAIYRRELRYFFNSPVAYAVIIVFLLLAGYFFYNLLGYFNLASIRAMQNPAAAHALNLTEDVVEPLFGNLGVIMLLILPLLGVVLAVLVYLEVSSMNPDEGSGYNDQDPVSRYQYSRAGTYGDRVVNAEFRVVDEPEKEKQARPVKTVSVPDTADQKKAKEQRSLYEEQKKKELAQELRARELERLKYIHGFYSTQYLEYLHEAEIFRKEFGKNVKCDVCGRWDGELFVHRSQTYCSQCLPGGSHPEHDRAVVAGKHGASIDHIKK